MPKTKIEDRATQFHPAYMGLSDYEAIKEDEKLAAEKGLRGSSGAARSRLKRDSEVGRYANPEYEGDLGQFLKTGGKVKGYAKGGVTRGDGCVSKGHTKGKYL